MDSRPATPSLTRMLEEKIQVEGAISFADFMAVALYEPGLGYYARGARQVGRGGDFFTSVSVGPLFGGLLARRFLREWLEMGSPSKWRIIECGAHDGKLAKDILTAISDLSPLAFSALEYVIAEPLPSLQAAQRETLASFSKNLRLMSDLVGLSSEPLPGIAFGNELLDALPFHIVEWKTGAWRECHVNAEQGQKFVWEFAAEITSPDLAHAVGLLGTDFPEGYRTEVRLNYREFMEPLTKCLSSGLLLWIDYGFARPEYYHPDRVTGTLRTFSNHRAAENPLTTPGEIDITAHIDFTAVAEAGLELGCQPVIFRNQGTWLTENGREWLISLENQPDPAALRQFQTLVHPAHLGRSFHVLELSWNQPGKTLSTEDRHRLAMQACPGPAAR